MYNFSTTITNEGAALLARIIANHENAAFKEARLSETNYVGQEATLTAGTFGGVRFTDTVIAASVIDSTTIKVAINCRGSSLIGAYNLYSIGIIIDDNGTDVLVAVCTSSDPLPIGEEFNDRYAFNVNLAVSSTSNITVTGTTAAVIYDIDVVDNLTSPATNKPLSANQGRLIADNLAANENVYGAKNLGIPLVDMTSLNLSTSNNSDGSLTVTTNGLACGGVNTNWSSPFILKKGTYQVSFGLDTDETPSLTGFAVILKVYSTSYWLCTSGDSVASRKITLAADTEVVWGLYCESGTVVATQTVYPMLRDARIIDPTFAPYAPTNHELMSYKANGKVGAKNLLDDSNIVGLDNMNQSGDIFTSNNTDTRSYFDLYIDIWDGTTYIQGLVNETVSSIGHYEYSVSIPNNANRLRVLHNGSQRNIGVNFNTSVTGAFIISLDITGVDPTTVGGLSFGNIMIRIAEDTDPNYQPYAKTNKQLTADKAERNDLATLNLTGSTNTTGAQIDEGTYFYLNGSYCKATTNIANGATFTLNTNFETVSVGGELFKITPRYITQIAVGATRSLTTELPRSYIIATYGSIGSALTIQAGVGYGKESSRHKTQSIISSSDVVYAVNDLTYGLDITNNTSTALTVSIIKLL